MTESLNLGGVDERKAPRVRRLNRVPIIVAIVLVVAFLAVIIYGLTSRGLRFGEGSNDGPSTVRPASSDADQLKRGIPDGIIGEPAPVILQPTPTKPQEPTTNPFGPVKPQEVTSERPALEAEAIWRARLEREQQEQWLRELQRQRMASLQADAAALDSPIAVDIGQVGERGVTTNPNLPAGAPPATSQPLSALDLYAAAMKAGAQNTDPNGQATKESFFNQDIADLGYLPKSVVPQMSPYELKRGSVIPATLVTGINSDLPGRITAQVSQNVYDSATGRYLLIPQGSKLFGRYDSKVAFGQNRVLVIWTDIIFPNGSTLQIGGMAGTDAAGYGGFHDRVDNHLLQTFGSAILVALIGAGTEMMLPQDGNSTGNNTENSARESFAETFGQISEQTVSKNLDVQPTLEIRPGYQFNVLVDQDMVLPGAFQ
ncbi:conjugal transfer protein TrbI [Mesorhizobium sp. B2-5-13]|uniref:IncP-type conjugal transfer protein TrbI n=1 Tax=unclassified Mesorhizobium TaxID=325217 RepID=UPI001129DA1C|nr:MULTISPECIES: IncP-type conjugal transfer protein TrbI [unclassified Mesorhizobium]TPJ81946.1 conjugal transfer protein TrbI [Mesorhizobium sp. B2-5-13]TPK45883.1 conjugal transfer protein TrbI [Mesorhizobium sp. B2-5-5]